MDAQEIKALFLRTTVACQTIYNSTKGCELYEAGRCLKAQLCKPVIRLALMDTISFQNDIQIQENLIEVLSASR